MRRERRNQVNASLDEELMRWVMDKAERERRTPAEIARMAIEKMRDEERKKKTGRS